jgi:membrane associated rhomboid family serine protease
MSAPTIIGYAGWVVILFFCGKWFLQGLKGTYEEEPQPPVRVKRWLLGRTIFAWFLVVFFGLMNIAAVNQTYETPSQSEDLTSPTAYGLGMMIGVTARIAGLALSLWWVRKLGRERRQRRRELLI